MPDFPKDNIFARSPRTDKLICPMIFVKGGKAVMCGTEFAEAHSGNLFKHIRELHKVIHNSRGIEFFALFKQKSALTLGMPLSKDEMVKLNDVYYEKGIGAVMDMLKERLPMPGYVGSPTSHTKLQQAGPVRVAVRIFNDKQWRENAPPDHSRHPGAVRVTARKHQTRSPCTAFRERLRYGHCLLALESARQPRQIFR